MADIVARNRLYVVAPTWRAFTTWCREHRTAPHAQSLMAVTPTNYIQRLQGAPQGLRYVETWWSDDGFLRHWGDVAETLRYRNAVHLTDAELADWLAGQSETLGR